MASDHSASSAMILRIRRTPDPEPGPVDLARGGIIGVGFEGCGAMLEVWPTVEDRSWVEVEDRLGIDGDSVVWVSCMLGLGNTGPSASLLFFFFCFLPSPSLPSQKALLSPKTGTSTRFWREVT